MAMHVKAISCWVRKVLGIAKGHKSAGNLCSAKVSSAFVAGFSLVFILEAGIWQSF